MNQNHEPGVEIRDDDGDVTSPGDDIRATMQQLLDALARKDVVDEQAKQLSGEIEHCKTEIKRFRERTGLDKFSIPGLSASAKEKFRAKYDPEKWTAILAWASATGNDHIVQRRLTDAKVVDLMDSGIELPDGLTVEAHVEVTVRRA